jgi:uncharacterized protein YbjT (DUF2867 family)
MFSDMGDVLSMAQSGYISLFAPGTRRINPIHGADLASAIADAAEAGTDWLDVGGPDIFTPIELARLAAAAVDSAVRIKVLPVLGDPAGAAFGLGAIAWFLAVGAWLVVSRGLGRVARDC